MHRRPLVPSKVQVYFSHCTQSIDTKPKNTLSHSSISTSVWRRGRMDGQYQWHGYVIVCVGAHCTSQWKRRQTIEGDILTGTSSCVKFVCAPRSSSSCLIFSPDCGLAGEFRRLSSPSWLSFGKGLSLKLLCEDACNPWNTKLNNIFFIKHWIQPNVITSTRSFCSACINCGYLVRIGHCRHLTWLSWE